MSQLNQTQPSPKPYVFTIRVPKPPVGFWVYDMGDGCTTKYEMRRKPSWLARVMMRLIFDIRWSENNGNT
jgi:hypothetical protein